MKEIVCIFRDFGCPSILHTDNGPEFKNMLLAQLELIWHDVHQIFGSPRHPQSQGAAERMNEEVAKALTIWVLEHNTYSTEAAVMGLQVRSDLPGAF